MSTYPTSFSIDESNKLYYNAKDICAHKPDLFKGIKTTIRRIIERKNIPQTEYVFACFNKKVNINKWNMSNRECAKAQLLISKEWVDANLFTLEVTPQIKPLKKIKKKKPIVVYESSDEEDESASDVEQENVSEKPVEPTYLPAPPLLELEFDEKFHDDNGNVLEIETRGERHSQKIFFRVKDVMKAFDMPNLSNTMMNSITGYKRGVDFVSFTMVYNIHPKLPKLLGKSNDQNKKPKTSLFLTYTGLLRVLFVSRNKHAEKFTAWASDKLFRIHLGTIEAKEELIADIQTNIDEHISVFKSYPKGFPCIYLLSLGSVKDLRATYFISDAIDDNLVVYKYGCSDNLSRRLSEHKGDYGKDQNVAINVVAYHVVDPKYKFTAESHIRNMFKAYGMSLNVSDRNELVVLDNVKLEQVKKDYAQTGREYAGATEEMQQQIQNLKLEIQTIQLVHANEKLETELRTNKIIYELEKEKYELQLQYFKHHQSQSQ